jgi:putative hydrolase of the HAD superfamily
MSNPALETPSAAQALLFDIDDTLISDTRDAWLAVRATVAALTGAEGGRADEIADRVAEVARREWARPDFGGDLADGLGISGLEALYSDFSGCHDGVGRLAEVGTTFKDVVWTQSYEACGIAPTGSLVEGSTARFREVRGDFVTVYPEVAEVLTALAERCPLGVVTNGPSDLQRLKLANGKLASYFGSVIISGELGTGKPSAVPFEAAMAQLGAAPESTTMFGDNEDRDVAGAHAAGIEAIHVSRADVPHRPPSTIVPSIADLRGLLETAAPRG